MNLYAVDLQRGSRHGVEAEVNDRVAARGRVLAAGLAWTAVYLGCASGADRAAAPAASGAVRDGGADAAPVTVSDGGDALWDPASPQVLFSRGCVSGAGGLYIIRADGTDERLVYPAGHSLKPELVYPPNRLLLAVDQDLYTVSLTTFEAARVVVGYAIGFSHTVPGNRWIYGSDEGGLGGHMHLLMLDSLSDVDLGVSTYTGTAPNGDIIYCAGTGDPRALMRYPATGGMPVEIALASSCGGVLADGRIYFGRAAAPNLDLYVTDRSGGNPHLILPMWNSSSLPLPLPDGRLLVSSVTPSSNDFLAVDPDTADVLTVVTNPYQAVLRGDVSTTGRFVFLRYGATAAIAPAIWSVRYDGAAPATLYDGVGAANGNAGDDVLGRSAGATVLYYRVRTDQYWDLLSVPDTGGSATPLGTTENHFGNVALLDGERVAFTRDGALFSIGLDGSDGRMLFSSPATKQIQAVLADGRILFETVRAADDDLSIVTPDGSNVVTLGQTRDCKAFELLAP